MTGPRFNDCFHVSSRPCRTYQIDNVLHASERLNDSTSIDDPDAIEALSIRSLKL